MDESFDAGTELFRNLSPEKQEKVFQAAVSEFASKGYRNASMNSLVRTAGISKGSIFQYFKTKRNLFDAILEMAVQRVKQHLKQVRGETEELPFPERLEKLLRSGFQFIDRHPLLTAVYFQLLQSGDAPFGSERLIQLRRQGSEFLSDLIERAVSRGELRSDIDIHRVGFLINSLLETLLRAYYTEFLDSGLGLYKGDSKELDLWIKTTVDLINFGIRSNAE
ncbi:MAG: TetR/AcrR family transcriptional regulator [Desulfomonile tiedjei]|uniref:TetR/AcrR family transcriptional regulator n=1 Tax=Desulfomonile tiedjei TaxID=2358 RepID=A0A9D6Z4V4_9BACT|nr:TetR/AcrR family transcriptional regulator [Desulfomonile tiedjei]